MLFLSLAENEDVAHVHNHDSLIDEFFVDVIHHCLECRWTVSETEEHDQGFKQALVHPKGFLPPLP